MTETPEISVEIARRTHARWMRIRRYRRELYNQTEVALYLKTRMVKAEAIKALLTPHRTPPGSCFVSSGHSSKRSDHRMTSCNHALEIPRCESISMTLRTRL